MRVAQLYTQLCIALLCVNCIARSINHTREALLGRSTEEHIGATPWEPELETTAEAHAERATPWDRTEGPLKCSGWEPIHKKGPIKEKNMH